ncbi:hypothetical protein Vretimale_2263 [Volvox reticuliferus]|nr:hypothetical protein Vretimale_2263 [Volvox reticuliferus]
MTPTVFSMEQSQSGTGHPARHEGGQSQPNGSVDGEVAATVAAMQQQLDTQLALSRTLTQSLTSMLQQAVTLRRMLEIALYSNRVTPGGDSDPTRLTSSSAAGEGSKGEHNQQPHKRQFSNGDIHSLSQSGQPGNCLAKRQCMQSDAGKGANSTPQLLQAVPNPADANVAAATVTAGHTPITALRAREPGTSIRLEASQAGAWTCEQQQEPLARQQNQASQHATWLASPSLYTAGGLLPNDPRWEISSALATGPAATAAAAAVRVAMAAPTPSVSGNGGTFGRSSTASGSGGGSGSGGAATPGWQRLHSAGLNSPAGRQTLLGVAFSPGLQAGTPNQQHAGTPSNGSKHGSNDAQDSESLAAAAAAAMGPPSAAMAATMAETAVCAMPLLGTQAPGINAGPNTADLSLICAHEHHDSRHQVLLCQQVTQHPKAKAGVELQQLVHSESQLQQLQLPRQQPIPMLEGNSPKALKQQLQQHPPDHQEQQRRRRPAQSTDSNGSQALLRLQAQQEALQQELLRCQYEQQQWQQRQEIQLLMQQQLQQQRHQQQQNLQQQGMQQMLQQQQEQDCKEQNQQFFSQLLQQQKNYEEADAKSPACIRTEPGPTVAGPMSGSPVSVATPLPCMQGDAFLSSVNSSSATPAGASQPAVATYPSGSLLTQLPPPLQLQLPALLPVPVLPPPPPPQLQPSQPDRHLGLTGTSGLMPVVGPVFGGYPSRDQCPLLDNCKVGDVINGSTGPVLPFQPHSPVRLQRNSSTQAAAAQGHGR